MYCIYCRKNKSEKDEKTGQSNFSLEHILPQALGGNLASEIFKTRQVCRECNNNLGQFVDASFIKDWFVSNALTFADRTCYSPDVAVDRGLLLTCMGSENITLPETMDDEVCETWLGPFGEVVIWVRKKDENLYWYTGGNPRTTKKEPSRAYFMFSKNSIRAPWLTLKSFKHAFSKRKVKRILCTSILDNGEETNLWFDKPDGLDLKRKEFIISELQNGKSRRGRHSIYIWSARRFLCKLSIGLLFSIFGEKFFNLGGAKALYRGLIGKSTDNPNGFPRIQYSYSVDKKLKKTIGIEGAIVIGLIPINGYLILTLNIGCDYACLIRTVSTKKIEKLNSFSLLSSGGLYWVICEPLNIFSTLNGFQFDGYKSGRYVTNKLRAIESQVKKSKLFFESIKNIETVAT